MAKSDSKAVRSSKSRKSKEKKKMDNRQTFVLLRRAKKKKKHPFEPDGVIGGDIAADHPFEPDGVIGGDIIAAHPFDPDGVIGGGDIFIAHPFDPDGVIGDIVPSPDEDMLDIIDGLYLGGNHRLALELRVDFDGSAIISGDLFSIAFGGRDYLASFRTAPGTEVNASDTQPWALIFETPAGAVASGELLLAEGMADRTVSVVLFADTSVPGLPAQQLIEMTAEWHSSTMRRLAVELEMEAGTSLPPSYSFRGENVTIGSVMSGAGIELSDIGATSHIPTPMARWGIEQLHGLMLDTTSGALDRPQWRQQLLWLGEPSRAGLLGVMFDAAGVLPRQGTAVFEGEIRRIAPPETERKIIQTTVHEIGHALNLAHRFEREVGRADSTSIMNYDWRYLGGGRRAEFWRNFAFEFDEDELAFLRHGARNKIIPGGAPFHSATYWADGNGGYSPYLPETPSNLLTLQLEAPPGSDGNIFDFGQPVLLKISLTNNMNQPLQFNRHLLDPKASFLEVIVRRIGSGSPSDVEVGHFQPLYERCLDLEAGDEIIIPPGGEIADNLNITFGSSGFAFAEPGMYDIQVVGSIPVDTNDNDPNNDHELIFVSNKLRIFVSYPKDRQGEADAVNVLFREDVGTFFTLGGSARLSAAKSDLTEICNRRLHGRKSVSDPIAANIIRCLGIDAGRWSYRLQNEQCFQDDGDPARAADYLRKLKSGKNAGLRAFDIETARTTLRLLSKHEKKAQK